MKKYYKIILALSSIFAAIFLNMSCSSMDSVQSEWSDGPEQIYCGKIDSLRVRSGMGKVEIVGNANYARTAKTCIVRYGEESVTFDMEDIIRPDGTVSMMVDNLTPGSYYFYVTTYDEDGNRSIVCDVYGTVYDADELKYLQPYTISSIAPRSKEGAVVVYWNEIGSTFFAATYLEMTYEDAAGKSHTIRVDPDENGVFPGCTVLDSWKPGTTIRTRTYVLKEETDLEPFVLEPYDVQIPEHYDWGFPHFDNGSILDLGISSDYNLSDEFTIELMMRCTEIQNKDGCIIGNTGGGDCLLLRTSHDKIEFYTCAGGAWNCISCGGIEAGRWYHVAITYKAGTEYTIYMDGEQKAKGSNCGVINASSAKLVIGTRIDYQYDYLVGDVQHVSVWDSARTAEQIKADMALDFPLDDPDLLGYFPLNIMPSSALLGDMTGSHAASYNNKVIWCPAE